MRAKQSDESYPWPFSRRVGFLGILITLLVVAPALKTQSNPPWIAPEAAKNVKNPIRSSPKVLAAGANLYRANCMVCHGRTGAGDGVAAGGFGTKPGNFTDAGAMDEMTDGELFWKITNGHGDMPSWGNQLSSTELWELVDYIRSFELKDR